MSSFIQTIQKNGEKIVLYKLNSTIIENEIQNSTLFSKEQYIAIIDLETTGTNIKEDKIIELAIKLIKIDNIEGHIIAVEDQYDSFQDPNMDIDEKITSITGISNEMVSGKEISWNTVEQIIDKTAIIAAHNARFDRGFLDRYMPISKEQIWACTALDIDWLQRGFVKSSLELLSIWHGFYYDSHRAMNDVDALIHLITHSSYNNGKPIVELINNSNIPHYKIIAKDSPFETKDSLRSKYYKWNSDKRYWWKLIKKDQIEKERLWLTDNVYNGYFQGIVDEIDIKDKYKD